MNKILSIFALIIIISCNSTSKKEEQIKSVVKQYFSLVKENKMEETPKLFWDSGMFSGAIQADAFFINKHYNELKIDDLIKNMKIKDTTSIIPSQKEKYIQFTIKKSEDNLPIIITFIFDEMNGFEKIGSPNVLQNHTYWNKSLDSLHQKGIFPRPHY